MRQVLIFLMILALAFGSISCAYSEGEDPGQRIVSTYFGLLIEKDYSSCYQMLDQSAKDRIALADFVNKHQNLFEAVGLYSVSAIVDSDSLADANYSLALPVTITYDTYMFGAIVSECVFNLTATNEGYKLAWTPSVLLEELGWNDITRVSTLRPKRGEILDAQSNQWAVNAYAPTAYVRLSGIEDNAAFAQIAGPLLSMDPTEVLDILESRRSVEDGIALLKTWPIGELDDDTENLLYENGISVDHSKYTPIRHYPQGSLLAHFIGYTQPIDAETLKTKRDEGAEYDESSIIGRTGLEAAYESTLMGKRGNVLSIIAEDGRVRKTVARRAAVDGLDLEITIDYELQRRTEQVLATLPADECAAAVVLDPSTGDILSAACVPSFDLNLFTSQISSEIWAALNDPANNSPLFNRVTQGRYAPGSTIKPFTGAMAVSSGKFSDDYVFPSGEVIVEDLWHPSYETWSYPDIKRAHGYPQTMNFSNAMAHSDNIYFAHLALKCGWDLILPYFERCGIGESMPFDLRVAASKIYTRDSLENRKLLADTGYGQGEMLISPLQLAVTFSAFANDGDIQAPRLVSATKKMNGLSYDTVGVFESEVWKEEALDYTGLSSIKPMLRSVMTEGTGRLANIPGLSVYGKTGTAQADDTQSREIAWLVAFVDEPDYKRLACVAIETKPNEGSMRYEIVRELLTPQVNE